MELKLQMKVEHEDDERNTNEWRREVKIDPKPDTYCHIFIGMIPEFESMWDGHLRHMSFTKHGIDLTSDKVRSVDCAPYITGPRARDLQKMEIDETLK